MPRLVISTVGTSVLTNQIDPSLDPDSWINLLEEYANSSSNEITEYYQDVSQIIKKLKQRAEAQLDDNDAEVTEIRKASAELNGIYGIYNKQLEQGRQDFHWLITTDTAQGQVAAEILRNFLQNHHLQTDIYTPKDLSTSSTEKFTQGIDELLKWMDDTIPGYKDAGYTICFNLVGGFKALQGYVNTIAMVYQADEIIYIFEGDSDIIKIPKLPIEVNKSAIKPALFALMAAEVNVWIKLSDLQEIPEALLFIVGDEATISEWGRLTWNNCKRELLTGNLLDFPCLVYEGSFQRDYKQSHVDATKKLDLHEVLAEISGTMIKFNRDMTRCDRRLHFTRYEDENRCEGGVKKNQIDHFYIKNTGWRVSCIAKDGKLYLRHYGKHDYVNNNP